MIVVMLIAGLTLLVALYVGELIAPSLNGMVKRLPLDAGGGCEDWLIVIQADRRIRASGHRPYTRTRRPSGTPASG
jgi:hypothetical protein